MRSAFSITFVFVPAGGACCAELNEGVSDPCEIVNEHGICAGVRRCRGADGWGICGGVEPCTTDTLTVAACACEHTAVTARVHGGGGCFETMNPAYNDGRYYVVYNDYEKVVLQMMAGTGVPESTVTLSTDNYAWPNMTRVNDEFSVVTQDAEGRTSVTTFDLEGAVVRERSGRLDHGEDELNMPYIAYEPTSASMAIVYLNDSNKIVFRSVSFVD